MLVSTGSESYAENVQNLFANIRIPLARCDLKPIILGELRLHRPVHDAPDGRALLRRPQVRGHDRVRPRHGPLRRVLHHHAGADRLRHLRPGGRLAGHRIPPRDVLHPANRRTSNCRYDLAFFYKDAALTMRN